MAPIAVMVDDGLMATTDELLTRITALEDRVFELEMARLGSPAIESRPAMATTTPPPPGELPAMSEPADASPVHAPRSAPSSEVLLRWVGVGLVFLAAAFFVSTAISRGWIGPSLQLTGAVAVGLLLIAWALRLAPDRDAWALAAGHGGVAVLGASVLLGKEGLDLYSTSAGIGATVVVVAIAWWLGLRLERASIVGSGVVQAVAVPWALWALSGAEDYSAMWVGGWLITLIVAAAATAVVRRWSSLRLVLFATVAVPLLGLAAEVSNGTDVEIAIAVIVGVIAIAVFVAGPPIEAARHAKAHPGPQQQRVEAIVSAFDQRLYSVLPAWAWGLFALLFLEGRDGASSWLAVGVAALTGLALLAFGSRLVPPMLAAGIVGASVVGSIGLAGIVNGPSLLIALTVQAIGLTWMAARTRDVLLALNAATLVAISTVWGGVGILAAVFDGATFGEHLAHLLVVGAVVAATFAVRKYEWAELVGPLAWIGCLAWLASVLGELPQGQMAVSIAWAICGAGLFVVGLRHENRQAANLGLATLAATVAKLVTVDLDAVDTIWRAALFFVVGLGLLRLGLLIDTPELGDNERPEVSSNPA